MDMMNRANDDEAGPSTMFKELEARTFLKTIKSLMTTPLELPLKGRGGTTDDDVLTFDGLNRTRDVVVNVYARKCRPCISNVGKLDKMAKKILKKRKDVGRSIVSSWSTTSLCVGRSLLCRPRRCVS